MVVRHELLLVLPALLHIQAGAEEVGHVAQCRSHTGGLPVERDHLAVGCEHQVVQPVVAVHEAAVYAGCDDPVGDAARHRLQDLRLVAAEVLAVALHEVRRRTDQKFLQEGGAVGSGAHQVVGALQCRVVPERSMQGHQVRQRGGRLFGGASLGLHTGNSGGGVVEEEGELGGIVADRRVPATGSAHRGPARQVSVEADLGRIALGHHRPRRRVTGGHLGDEGVGAVALGPADTQAVGGAHLPGAHRLGGNRSGHEADADGLQGCVQPVGRDVLRILHQCRVRQLHPLLRCGAPSWRRHCLSFSFSPRQRPQPSPRGWKCTMVNRRCAILQPSVVRTSRSS